MKRREENRAARGRGVCLFIGPVIPRALLAALLSIVEAASAQAPIPGYPNQVTEYDAREVALLPRFCTYTQDFRERVPGGNDREQIERWRALMGPSYEAMHHYCWGLMKLHRATILARDATTRRFYYGSAVDEFDYVLRNVRPDFAMLPEILTKRGEALLGAGRAPQAIAEFERAIELKPDYWPSYARLSDYYKSTGDLAGARQILGRGLARSPDAKGLLRRLKELDDEQSKPIGSAKNR
jgi:tetratricopeptide (TPR) repeat protein